MPAGVGAQLVASLRESLMDRYSLQLYGARDRMPSSRALKVVYLRLLDNATLSLNVPYICQCNSEPQRLTPFYKTHSWHHNVADVAWIHSVDAAIPSDGWAEVTHCPDEANHGAWFYVAPGAGISINVGRTLVLDYHKNKSAQMLHSRADHMRLRQQFDAQYDSVQFLHRKHSFSKELKHELVMLRWKSDDDFVKNRQCGRAPDLMGCSDHSLPVVMQRRCSRDYTEPWLRERFPLASLGASTPYCKAPAPMCSGPGGPMPPPKFTTASATATSAQAPTSTSNTSTWEGLLAGGVFEHFKTRIMERREEDCPFRPIGKALLRARKASCPSHCNASKACCDMVGHANTITRLASQDAVQLHLSSAILRTSHPPRNQAQVLPLVESAFLALTMGDLGVAPKVHALWLSNTSRLSMVTEEYISLAWLLTHQRSGPSLRGVEGALRRHVDTVARFGIVLLDFHPGNVLVRPRDDGGYEARLIDFDTAKFVIPVKHLSLSCRKLVMLSIFSLVLACGTTPRRAFAAEIVENARSLLPKEHCGGGSNDLLGRVQSISKGHGEEWSTLSTSLKHHLFSLMRRKDLIPSTSPCRRSSGSSNLSVSDQGVLNVLRRLLPSPSLPML